MNFPNSRAVLRAGLWGETRFSRSTHPAYITVAAFQKARPDVTMVR